ncbi:MAG: hypothetical protein WCI28_05495, partial [Opitutaceae bacterium]
MDWLGFAHPSDTLRAAPLPPPAKRDPVVELRSHPGLSVNLLPQSGCPTWIRTMTRRVKVACA